MVEYLVATAQDPDRHHYPIAFGVFDGENDASWRWFLNMLKRVVPDDPKLVFVSDRNASIIKTICEVYPMSKHGYCIFHLPRNVKTRVHGINKKLVAEKFRECAQAYTEADFERMYDAFKTRYPKAADYLDESWQDVRKWARCYFPGERYNIDTTNCTESINAIFREAKKYSLLPTIDAIVGKIAEWFNKHRKASNEVSPSQKLVPFVAGVLHTSYEIAKKLRLKELNSIELKHSVIGCEGIEYLVDLKRKRCSCKHFDIDKYPCEHALASAMTYTST